MTILTQPGHVGQHRRDPDATHSRADRIGAAVRAAHAPLRRGEIALLAFAGGLATGVLGSSAAVLIGGPW